MSSANSSDYKSSDHFSDSEDSGDEISEAQDPHGNILAKLQLREYQEELAEDALKGSNAVICAPTGSGKTRVATYIILNHLKQEKRKKVAFLARTVPLALQQCSALDKYLSTQYQIRCVTGQSNESMTLESVITQADVVVMTPMILQNNLERTGLSINKFSLLVFDECHHTRKGEPYNKLMASYLKVKLRGSERKKANLPQVVGLTASIGIENALNIKEAIESILNVLSNLDAPNLCTVKKNIDELQELVPVPYEQFHRLSERVDNDAVQKINEVMEKLESCIKKHAQALNDDSVNALVRQLPKNRKNQDYGQWAVKLKQLAKTVPISENETNLDVRSLLILSEYLVDYNVALEAYDLVELSDVINFLNKCFAQAILFENRTQQELEFYQYYIDLKKDLTRKALEDENPNLTLLSRILLKKLNEKGDEARCIIFVRTRALADSLATWLNRHRDLDLKNLNAKIFTGINASEEEGGMTPKLQEDTIQSFRSGETKVLVATSVAEEGLDIPDCNLIIKYNHVGNEVSTVQTKGRARKLGGTSVLLAMEKVMRRELGNQEKAKLMKDAIQEISKMNASEILKYIEDYQQKRMEEAEIEEKLANEKRMPREKVFTMMCSFCRKVGVDNTKIRTIYNAHRVSIDSDLLKSDKVRLVNKKGNTIDGIEFLGPVYCQGMTDEGKICGKQLGSRIKFKKNVYFTLGIKNFGFYIGTDQRLQHFKKWDSVPYSVDELCPEDEYRYAVGEDSARIVISDNDSSSSSDEEDSSKCDVDLKGKTPASEGECAAVKSTGNVSETPNMNSQLASLLLEKNMALLAKTEQDLSSP